MYSPPYLAVEVDLPGPGVGVVLDGVLLAAGEHAADQALGAGDSRGGEGLGLLLARVLDERLDLGHTYGQDNLKLRADDSGLTGGP